MTIASAITGTLHALSRAFAFALALPIRFYRYFISPLLGRNCRYDPTCSAYALQALDIHGPVKGSYLAARRILRCHPVKWLGGGEGFDPVPLRRTQQLAAPCGHDHSHITARTPRVAEGKKTP